MSAGYKAIQIIKEDGSRVADIRPMVHCSVSVVASDGKTQENGSYGFGGRTGYSDVFNEKSWKNAADEAVRQAVTNLDAIEAPAGEMVVVLGAGWPGVMLHEAVGHGLEADSNRKNSSVFSGKVGQKVASDCVTVIDEGNILDRRGSVTIDDEGTPTQKNVLIEKGVLKGYMQDRMNARLMNVAPTGNGRRQSFEHPPVPRMTNTYMEAGNDSPEDIIKSVKKGLYAKQFGGGQVDTTSGNFVFNATEAYLIENGKITKPVKGVTLMGNGPDAMMKIDMVGNDLELDKGIGSCGKAGQWVPVGVGQPTVKMRGIKVGGTKGPA
jgi:TldD protein